MALQISPKDTDLLLKQKNVLSRDVIDKYSYAGQITQTCLKYIISLINDSYHLNKHEKYSPAELCLLGDSYMQTLINQNFKKIEEKGIAQPVTLDINNILSGYSPELNDINNSYLQVGDIVTINLGCHIDGYTSNLAHTIVIYPNISNGSPGPLLGESSDAIIASYLATEAVITLLACSLTPEKIPNELIENGNKVVTGSMIRKLVNSIAQSYNCIVVPTSKVRRIRRFLAGQAEGVVAERDFKGVVWSEQDQEDELIKRASSGNGSTELTIIDSINGRKKLKENDIDNTIPSDEFIVKTGEVYSIDIKMSPINKEELGIVTLNVLNSELKPSIFIRDVSISEQLKLRNSRKLLSLVDKKQSVYPFKLSYISENFPIKGEDLNTELNNIEKDVKTFKFGVGECINKQLFVNKAILSTKFIPLREILKTCTSTGINGYDASKASLPGLELPLPKLGVTSLKMKTLMKKSLDINVIREMSTIALSEDNGCIRLSGGKEFGVSYVHSEYELNEDVSNIIKQLSALREDERFGIKVVECGVL